MFDLLVILPMLIVCFILGSFALDYSQRSRWRRQKNDDSGGCTENSLHITNWPYDPL